MRVNLSVEKIAGALAALGTSALIAACGGGEEPKTPVTSTEVPATDKASGDAAGHCGADKAHAGGQAACSATKAATDATPATPTTPATPATPPKTDMAAPATPSADATKAATDPAKAATPATTSTATKKAPAAPTTPPAGGTKKTGGAASCGAGTCSAKK